MGSGDIVVWIMLAVSIACFFLSIIIACRKLSPIYRVFPVILQISFWVLAIFPMTHGFPSEAFRLMVFSLIWSVVASILGYKLYWVSMRVTRIYSLLQFIQTTCIILLSGLGYVSSCWNHYGHIVWNP